MGVGERAERGSVLPADRGRNMGERGEMFTHQQRHTSWKEGTDG